MLSNFDNRYRPAVTPRTSLTHPLHISVIGTPFRGRLGVTLAPGKKDPSSYPAPWARDLQTDLDTIVAWDAEIVLTLLELHEIASLGLTGLGDAIRDRGIDWLHLPIGDVSIPDAVFERAWPAHSAALRRRLRAGENLIVHCRGGLGRAGMIAARLLVEEGVPAEAAIASVRAARPGAIETDAQEDWVRQAERAAELSLGDKLTRFKRPNPERIARNFSPSADCDPGSPPFQGWLDEAMANDLFRGLWSAHDRSAFRAFVFAALSQIEIAKYSPPARAALYTSLATAKRASFLDAVYSSKGWRRCLRLLPKTEFEAFRSSDWEMLLAAGGQLATRKALGYVTRITPCLVRQLALIPEAIHIAAVFEVLTTLDVPEHHWRRLCAALDAAPRKARSSLLAKATKIRSYGTFWSFLSDCFERPWRPIDLPPSFLGNGSLEPLRTRADFESEGLAMRNCLANEFDEARRGRRAYFRWRGSTSATVEFRRTPTGWRLGQIIGVDNKPLTARAKSPIIAAANSMLANTSEIADVEANASGKAIDAIAKFAAISSSNSEIARLARALADVRGRSLGRGPDTAYCIFRVAKGFVQFMDQDHGREILCEVQSHRFSAELDQNLKSQACDLLEATGFSWPHGAQNFRRRFEISNDEDIRKLAALALCLLREIFGARDLSSVTVETHTPSILGNTVLGANGLNVDVVS